MTVRLAADSDDNNRDEGLIWRPGFGSFGLLVLAVVALIGLMAWKPPVVLSEIRVRNGSGVTFDSIVVNGHDYGSLAPGAVSVYRSWGPAYRYAAVRVRSGERTYRIQPTDYVGETILGRERFTYVLTLQDSKSVDGLDIRAERDNP